MVSLKLKTESHPEACEIADFLSGNLSKNDRERMEKHLSSCSQCLDGMVAAYDSVKEFNKKRSLKKLKDTIMNPKTWAFGSTPERKPVGSTKINIYLLLAVISFIMSFIAPRYFIQLLVATLLLGIKWIVDSKSTKMLIMIHEAWKRDGAKGASDALKTLEKHRNNRL